jgi:hypothetical protein
MAIPEESVWVAAGHQDCPLLKPRKSISTRIQAARRPPEKTGAERTRRSLLRNLQCATSEKMIHAKRFDLATVTMFSFRPKNPET